VITKEELDLELAALDRGTYTAIPSQLAPDKVRTQVIHGRPAIRHTPRRRSLSERDRERSD
jgi:hypothetical protein